MSISPRSEYMTTISTEFGKLRYNPLLMAMCASGDIFQAKVDKILGDLEGVKIYINDILVLSNESFYKQINKQRGIFSRLSSVGLKSMRLSTALGESILLN